MANDDDWLRQMFGTPRRQRRPTRAMPLPGVWPNTLKCCNMDQAVARNRHQSVINGNVEDYYGSYRKMGRDKMAKAGHLSPVDWMHSTEQVAWEDSSIYGTLSAGYNGVVMNSAAACPVCGAKMTSNPNPDEDHPETRTVYKGAVWHRNSIK